MIQFYVGERPSDPLVVTVTDDDGNPIDLTGVGVVTFVGDPLPAGDATVSNPAEGKVQYEFTSPFTEAENLRVQVKMETAGDIDYSAPFTISVQNPADTLDTIVTPQQVELWTNVSVSQGDVVRAQSLICLVVGRDLTDVVWLASVGTRDMFWLGQAVAWQAAYHPQSDEIYVPAPYIPGATSLSNGDVSITFADGVQQELVNLASNARLAVKRLSWMRPVRSLSATPFLGRRDMTDEEWTNFVYLLPGGHR